MLRSFCTAINQTNKQPNSYILKVLNPQNRLILKFVMTDGQTDKSDCLTPTLINIILAIFVDNCACALFAKMATLINILLPILAIYVDICACALFAKNGNFDKHIIANIGNFY